MTLEEQIARIVALDCLTPTERAAMILTLPSIQIREIRVSMMDAVAAQRKKEGKAHGRATA